MSTLLEQAVPAHGQWMIPAIEAAAAKYGLNPLVLAAITAWETDYGHAPGYEPKGAADGAGDRGHGHTPWQIDDHAAAGHRDFLETADLADIQASTDYIARNVVLPAIKHFGSDHLREVFAAYNAGIGAVARAVARGDDPGAVTTATPYGTYPDAVQHKLEALASAAGVDVPQDFKAAA